MNENLNTFNNSLPFDLNNEQHTAVHHTAGVVLVIACAGSGKTRVITARIINLIVNKQVAPESIVALTFTNKAAGEMRERIAQHLPPQSKKPFIGTFHAYCLTLLKTYTQYLGLETFTILDSDDQQTLLAQLIKKNNLEKKISAKQLSYQISMLKNKSAGIDNEHYLDPLVKELYYLYEKEKKQNKTFDFDDLLIEVLRLFTTNKEFKKKLQEKIKHVLIDEYQDTNTVQHALLKAMCLDNDNFSIDSLCVVGDEDQSIYSWRGATVTNILNFKEDFPTTTLVTIEQNYRSVLPILNAANNVIKHNKYRNPKKLWSDRPATDRIRVVHCMSNYQEGEALSYALKHIRTKMSLNKCALLYRAHYQSRTIEEALIRHSLPYTILGGIQFYERKEIKDLLAYLRLVVNPFDKIALSRAINCPHRGLGEKFQELFLQEWDKEPFYNFHHVAEKFLTQNLIAGTRRAALHSFINLYRTKKSTDNARELLEFFINKTEYFTYLHNSYEKQEAEAKIENVKELIRATAHFDQAGLSSVADFLNHVALMQEKIESEDEEENKVQLMTLHAAKGLEFDMIILTGLEEGIFPSTHSVHLPETLEEERRLFYVGITRAKEYLLLLHTKHRYTFGTMTDQTASRFLDEIPDDLASRFDGSFWNNSTFNDFFSLWLGTKKAESTLLTFGTPIKKSTPPITAENNKTISVKAAPSLKENQSVKHATFGIGIVKKIEPRGDTVFVTVRFTAGIKKIQSTFLTSL